MGISWITPTEITPATQGSWVDVDISSYIASGSTGIVLHIENTSATAYNFGLQKNGSTDNRTSAVSGLSHKWMSCGVDANCILEMYIENITSLNIYLVGYFDGCAEFNTNVVDISTVTTDEWTDIDLGVDDGAIGAIVEITSSVSGYSCGLRKNGSTDEIYPTLGTPNVCCFIGVDEDEIFETKISDVGVSHYLVGYLKSGAVFNTNATDLSLSTIGEYIDLEALPDGAIGGFIEVANGDTSYNYSLRENGSSENIYRKIYRHYWGIVECDYTNKIEGKIENTDVKFYLTGYLTRSSAQTTLYKCETEITNRDIDIVITDRDIGIGITNRIIGLEVEVT